MFQRNSPGLNVLILEKSQVFQHFGAQTYHDQDIAITSPSNILSSNLATYTPGSGSTVRKFRRSVQRTYCVVFREVAALNGLIRPARMGLFHCSTLGLMQGSVI